MVVSCRSSQSNNVYYIYAKSEYLFSVRRLASSLSPTPFLSDTRALCEWTDCVMESMKKKYLFCLSIFPTHCVACARISRYSFNENVVLRSSFVYTILFFRCWIQMCFCVYLNLAQMIQPWIEWKRQTETTNHQNQIMKKHTQTHTENSWRWNESHQRKRWGREREWRTSCR